MSREADAHTFWVVVEPIALIGLAVLATYFILNEIKQLIRSPVDYLSSVWNYIDVIPVFGIYLMTILNFVKFFADNDILIS
jgi:hypothetical protein